ncbi:acetyl-mannosamine transferase [Terribacillus saccharophilus]|nr:acetyl-mannosamine transferase [Terribacillus saccharophilus]
MNETLEQIQRLIYTNIQNRKYSYVLTPNVDHIINIQKDDEFNNIYEGAEIKIADGMPIVWASKILRKPLKERVTGADLTPKLIEMAYQQKLKVFIFGSKEGVAAKAVAKYKKSFGEEFEIECYSPPFGFENSINEVNKSIDKITSFRPDILLVSLGSPKGEFFIKRYIDELRVPVSLQIGAAIDFIAGTVNRAPKWMQKCGLEWFYRFLQEPKRMFKRYFVQDMLFIILLIKEFRRKKIYE